MKKISIILALLIFGLGYSQTILNNFEIENDKGVVYKRVFEKNGNSNEEIISFFKSLSNVYMKDIPDGQTVAGYPAIDIKDWRRAAIKFQKSGQR